MARENCQCWTQARISGVVLSGLRGKGGPMGFGCGGLGMRDQGIVAIVCLSACGGGGRWGFFGVGGVFVVCLWCVGGVLVVCWWCVV